MMTARVWTIALVGSLLTAACMQTAQAESVVAAPEAVVKANETAGLKTAVLTLVRKEGLVHAADIAAAFQEAAVDVLVTKSLAACQQRGAHRLVVAGGVGANQRLRLRLTAEAQVREMCEKLLANTVIESYRVEISG